MPYHPRADRPELLTYYISAIKYLLSITYYGPEILVDFLQAFLAIFPNFPCKNLIFSIKQVGCGSNEGLTVFLG